MNFCRAIIFLLFSLPAFSMDPAPLKSSPRGSPTKNKKDGFSLRKSILFRRQPVKEPPMDLPIELPANMAKSLFMREVAQLQAAIKDYDIEAVQNLLQDDEDTLANTPSQGPDCPIVLAIKTKDFAIVKLLIDHEACVQSKSIIKSQEQPLEQSCLALAFEISCFEITNLLLEYGARLLEEEVVEYFVYFYFLDSEDSDIIDSVPQFLELKNRLEQALQEQALLAQDLVQQAINLAEEEASSAILVIKSKML